MAAKGVFLVLVLLMMSATVLGGSAEYTCLRNCEKLCPTQPPTVQCARDCAIDCQHGAAKLKLHCFLENCRKLENDRDGFQSCVKACSS